MITNRSPYRCRRPLSPARAVLYAPRDQQWSYSHHAAIASFQGRLYATWSNGRRDEDDLGQRVLYAVSEDGVHWSPHRVLFSSRAGQVLTAAGLYVHAGTLTAYAGAYGYAPENVSDGRYITINDEHVGTTVLCKTTENGEAWSAETDLHLPSIPNHGPCALASGRLLISGGVTFPYTDDASGLGGFHMSGIAPFPYPGFYDDSEGVARHAGLRGDGILLCEGSFFQTDDGVVHMLLRSDARRLYETRSADDGETWCAPAPTDFMCASSKFHCGRLPDGRFYIVGNPDPAGARCPLVISLSCDGECFDREYIIDDTFRPLRMPGKYKGGIYGYPHSLIDGDQMRVICSVNKEDVCVYSFPLSQLD